MPADGTTGLSLPREEAVAVETNGEAVVLPLVSPESSPYPQTTEAALAAYKAHPDRIIPFCCIDPRVTTGPFPSSRKVYVAGRRHGDLRVAMREIDLEASANEPPIQTRV